LPPSVSRTAPPRWGCPDGRRPGRRRAAPATGRRGGGGAAPSTEPQEGGFAPPLQQETRGAVAPLQQRERGLAPLSGQAQGPRWAPGCPQPPATAGGAPDRGGSGHPKEKGRRGLCPPPQQMHRGPDGPLAAPKGRRPLPAAACPRRGRPEEEGVGGEVVAVAGSKRRKEN